MRKMDHLGENVTIYFNVMKIADFFTWYLKRPITHFNLKLLMTKLCEKGLNSINKRLKCLMGLKCEVCNM